MATQGPPLEEVLKLTTPIPLKEDVLQMARDARRDQGIHEQEVSFNGEAGLHESLNSCEKNPEHKGFTPITELCAERLPDVLRTEATLEFIRSKAKETVRLSCYYTSPARPDRYCFSNYRGSRDLTRYGSGRVWSVYVQNVRNNIPCPFADCTEQCGTGWCEETEVEKVERKDEGISLAKEDSASGSMHNRSCQKTPCAENKEEESFDTDKKLNSEKQETLNHDGITGDKKDGQPCQRRVTKEVGKVGEEICKETKEDRFCLEESDGKRKKEGKLDTSVKGRREDTFESCSKSCDRFTTEEVKDVPCERGATPCASNSRSIAKSTIDKVSSSRITTNYEIERETSQTAIEQQSSTPRADSSENQSNHMNKTAQSQTSCSLQDTRNASANNHSAEATQLRPENEYRISDGTLSSSPPLETDSPHATSKASQHLPSLPQPTPHYVSGFFRIHTAKHVVFDDAEAQRTIIEFFYDDHRDTRHVVRARGYRVVRSDLDGDYCVMDCVTHDPNLGVALDAVRCQWMGLWGEVKDRVYGEDFSLVISHPHGCSKQFSLGKCLNREWGQTCDGQGWYRYMYDAATCPGSSGAPVWIPGRDGLISGYAPHSGCEAQGAARSAVWFYWNMKKDK